MRAEQVDRALQQRYLEDRARIVFWNDQNGEFEDYIKDGLPNDLSEVKVVREKDLGGMATKLLEKHLTSLVVQTNSCQPYRLVSRSLELLLLHMEAVKWLVILPVGYLSMGHKQFNLLHIQLL